MKYILNVMPIVFSLLWLPIWILDDKGIFASPLGSAQIISSLFLIPAYLIVANIYLINKKKSSFALSMMFVIIIIVINAFIHYFEWGITVGDFINPDNGTIMILITTMCFSIVVSSLALVIFNIIFISRKRRR